MNSPSTFTTISGAEDNALKLLSYKPNDKSQFLDPFCYQTINSHTAGIRNLCVIPSSSVKNGTLVFSCAGSNEICCSRFHPLEPTGFCEPIHLTWVPPVNPVTATHLGTRVMDLSAVLIEEEKHLYCIVSCQTDGLIRVFMFDESQRKMWDMAYGKYHSAAVFSIGHIKVENTLFLVSGDSRGFIYCSILDLSKFPISYDESLSRPNISQRQLEPLFSEQLHLAGVNSLHVSQTKENGFLVVSGSDDQSLHLSRFQFSGNLQKLQKIQEFHKPAHNASVVSLSLVQNYIFTTSPDQRVNIWKIDQTVLSLIFVDSVCSDVSDTHGMDAICINGNEYYIAVIGAGGLELFRFKPA